MARLALVVLLAGCSPLTAHRQSALLGPAAPPPITGPVLEPGLAAVGGGFEGGLSDDHSELWNLFPQPGDPGVLVEPSQVHGWARVGLAEGVEVAVRGELSPRGTERRSAIGVLPVPEGLPWAVGATLGLERRADSGLGVVCRADAAVVNVPWAHYELLGAVPDDYDWTLGDGSELYRLTETGAEQVLRVGGSLEGSYARAGFDGQLGVALVQQFTNVGFSDKEEPPVKNATPAAFATLGGGWTASEVVRVGVRGWGVLGGGAANGRASPQLGVVASLEARFRVDD
jgi:hypothetical protein